MITFIDVRESTIIKLGICGHIYEQKGGVLTYSISITENHDQRK